MDLSEFPSRPFRRHPWEEVRFRFLYDVVHVAGLDRSPTRVLDVGAGDGWFASRLRDRMPPGTEVTCWDSGYANRIPYSAPPGIRFVASRPDGTFDMLLLLDVLEHVEDDRSFLASLVERSLRPGAAVLITVPAWPWLYGEHDVRLHHFRRYRPVECARLLQDAGLEIVERGGLFHSALFVRSASNLLQRARGPTEDQPEPLQWRHGVLQGYLTGVALGLDTRMSSWFSRLRVEVPGLSWWARCRKPS